MSAILAAIGVIASFLSYQLAGDAINKIGKEAATKVRALAADIAKVMNQNSQMLADFKTANENKKAGLINNLISSSGLGARADAIKKMVEQAKKKDKEVTDKVTEANAKASKAMTEADLYAQNAQAGLIGAADAYFNAPKREDFQADQYKVNDPNQNIAGGLSGGKD